MHKINALADSQSVGALPFRGRAVAFAVLSVPESTDIIAPACMTRSTRVPAERSLPLISAMARIIKPADDFV